jgi:steroid 5-alpha reductase family enzyme
MHILHHLLAGWALAALLMTFLWWLQRRTGNAGIVDVGWAASIGTLTIAAAFAGPGDVLPRTAAAIMGAVWGWRLALHIHRRSHGRPEDGRYQQLRREWGEQVQVRMFRFYQLQALTVAFFVLPFVLLASAASRQMSPWLWIGLALWACGVVGETKADAQLEAFKRDPASRGRVCRQGLWAVSRHPNYFFEWLTWCGMGLAPLGVPWGWTALLCPLAIFLLLWRVTGIPATEAQALRSKGDEYRAYQRSTSAFFPWFPGKGTPT